MRSSSLLVVALLLAACLAMANADGGSTGGAPAPSAWMAVDTNDKTIQQVGLFAVHIFGLSTGKPLLTLVKVVSGQSQPFNGGYSYLLVISASNAPGGTPAPYDVSAWGIPGTTTWKLWSFTPAMQ